MPFAFAWGQMNILNNLILMVAGFDLFVLYLICKAINFYRNN